MSSPSKSAPKCAFCSNLAMDVLDTSDGTGVPLCEACLASIEETPDAALPWEYAYEPDDADTGAHEWLGRTVANDRFDAGEAA